MKGLVHNVWAWVNRPYSKQGLVGYIGMLYIIVGMMAAMFIMIVTALTGGHLEGLPLWATITMVVVVLVATLGLLRKAEANMKQYTDVIYEVYSKKITKKEVSKYDIH